MAVWIPQYTDVLLPLECVRDLIGVSEQICAAVVIAVQGDVEINPKHEQILDKIQSIRQIVL